MKFEYLGPVVTNEIIRMLLEKEVQGGILLKNKSVVSNTFVDSGDGSERPFRINSENSWYSHNLRYFAVHGGGITENKGLAIIGFKDKADIEQLQGCLRRRYRSLEDYEFNEKANSSILTGRIVKCTPKTIGSIRRLASLFCIWSKKANSKAKSLSPTATLFALSGEKKMDEFGLAVGGII